jgi:hypothetical protein
MEQRHAELTKEMSSWPVNPKDPARHVDKVQVKRIFNPQIHIEFLNDP